MITNIKYRIIALSFLLALLNVKAAKAQLPLIESIEISPTNYVANFKEINEVVVKHYSHLKTKNINMDSLRHTLEQQILVAKDKEEYFKILLRYFSKLRNSHTTLYLGDYGIDCSAILIEDRLFLTKVNDASFIKSGIKIKDEIISIDGVSIYEWLVSQMQYISASTFPNGISKATWKVFNTQFNGNRVYEIRTAEGIRSIETQLNVPVDYRKLFSSNTPKASGSALNDSFAYISVESLTDNVVTEFREALENLKSHPNLIIDLRNNTGGNSDLGEQIVSLLVSKSLKGCVSRKKITPSNDGYNGNLYLLIGVKTASAAESFVLDLLECGRATLVGSPTAGDSGNGPKNFKTSFGTSFRIPTRRPAQVSFNNFPMEGMGIPPQFSVVQSVDDYLKDIDTVLEFTLKKIGTTK